MKIAKLIIFLLLFSGLSGCGEAPASSSGVVIDSSFTEFLRAELESTKSCLDIGDKGSFDDLLVVLMPPSFSCRYGSGSCSGLYTRPAIIQLGLPWAWRQEVIHYLHDVNLGDPDPSHFSEDFVRCD